ncbi:hypothetical protein EG328_004497 [Venturia inaequalis]|uniref:Uncharacterized protein n=1 Tax=Venturia inaequalis TaxID=5025 RepID=A0A8H3YTU1_VENIN|nr:hypothetical protein EG328_004497 [Venturia inaequalis]RDI85930.1 hypothetical protein Vi05172_g4089 [Venturia inaequalis]
MSLPKPSESHKSETSTSPTQPPEMFKDKQKKLVTSPAQLLYRQSWTPTPYQKSIGLTLPHLAYLYNAYETLWYENDIPAKDHGKTITWRRMMQGFWEYFTPQMPKELLDGEFGTGLGGKKDMFERECCKEMRREEWLGENCPYNWSEGKEDW